MIEKVTSGKLMDILENSQERIYNIEYKVDTIQTNLEEYIKICTNYFDHVHKEMQILSEKSISASDDKTFVLAENQEAEGEWAAYGLTVHPKAIRTPINIFNFYTAVGPIFKDNASVAINSLTKEKYKNILMDDQCKEKKVFLEEYESEYLLLEVKVNPKELFGATSFNTIEILPHIPGSFSIMKIDIYSMQDYKTGATDYPTYIIGESIQDAGMSRIVLENAFDLYKIVFHIKLQHKTPSGKYAFGLRHLFFLHSDYSKNSHYVLPIESDEYIDSISEDIIIRDQYGVRESTCEAEDIKLYLNYNNGDPNYEIFTSKGISQYSIPKNVHSCVAVIPIHKSIISIKFKKITTR